MQESPFRRARLRAQMTLSDVARRTGIPLPTLSRYDWGKTQPNARMIPLLAAVLGCEPAALIPPLTPGQSRTLLRLVPRRALAANDLESAEAEA